MQWQRSKTWDGEWEDVPLSRVPPTVLRRYSRRVMRGEPCLYVPAYSYYYRVLFCV